MGRNAEFLSPQRIVGPTVFKVDLQSAADFEAVVACDGDVALIEEPVDIRPQEQPVRYPVFAALRVGADVGRFEGGQRVLAGDRAGATVSLDDADPKDPLT